MKLEKSTVRTCERSNSTDKVSREGEGGCASGAGAEIPWQPVMQTMVNQLCPCSPWRTAGSRDPRTAHAGAHARVDGCLRGGCETTEDPWRKEPMLEQPVLEELRPKED